MLFEQSLNSNLFYGELGIREGNVVFPHHGKCHKTTNLLL